MAVQAVSIGRRITLLAAEHPARKAAVFVDPDGNEQELTWAELDCESTRAARLIADRAAEPIGPGCIVAIGYPNDAEHVLALLATWKLGGCTLPLNPRIPPAERHALLDVAQPAAVLADWPHPVGAIRSLAERADFAADPLPDVVPRPGRALASGGSTGRPKLIVDPGALAVPPGAYAQQLSVMGARQGHTQLVGCPLFHNFGNGWLQIGLFEGHTIVIMERFDAALAIDLIERHRITFATVVPTMMQRILRLPDIGDRDLSSLEALLHTGGPCPEWAKRGWIERIGAERVYEVFGATEAVGACTIRGDEWLARPGSVGRPFHCEVKIRDHDGRELPPGEIGEIFMRQEGILPTTPGSTSYEYKGAVPAKRDAEGFSSVGDLGWLDGEGWLYLADRRTDLIVTGGANVYPAEVEAVLSAHPDVVDVAVIGLPDPDLGKAVHAVVELSGTNLEWDALRAHCLARLAPYKVPRSFERVTSLPRNEAGKLRKFALVDERARGAG